jgi:hypothetical protein
LPDWSRQLGGGYGLDIEVGRIEVIFTGDPDECE